MEQSAITKHQLSASNWVTGKQIYLAASRRIKVVELEKQYLELRLVEVQTKKYATEYNRKQSVRKIEAQLRRTNSILEKYKEIKARLLIEIFKTLPELDGLEQKVFEYRFLQNKKCPEIAELLEISRDEANKIITKLGSLFYTAASEEDYTNEGEIENEF
jgi:DNA-directed RNA polymerase specialized sigma subunit